MTTLSMSMFATEKDYWKARAVEAEADNRKYKTALEKIHACENANGHHHRVAAFKALREAKS